MGLGSSADDSLPWADWQTYRLQLRLPQVRLQRQWKIILARQDERLNWQAPRGRKEESDDPGARQPAAQLRRPDAARDAQGAKVLDPSPQRKQGGLACAAG